MRVRKGDVLTKWGVLDLTLHNSPIRGPVMLVRGGREVARGVAKADGIHWDAPAKDLGPDPMVADKA